MARNPADAPRVELKTSMGTLEVELYVKHAPKDVQEFRGAGQERVLQWDHSERLQASCTVSTTHTQGQLCPESLCAEQAHRIISDFMIQLGDPTGVQLWSLACPARPQFCNPQ